VTCQEVNMDTAVSLNNLLPNFFPWMHNLLMGCRRCLYIPSMVTDSPCQTSSSTTNLGNRPEERNGRRSRTLPDQTTPSVHIQAIALLHEHPSCCRIFSSRNSGSNILFRLEAWLGCHEILYRCSMRGILCTEWFLDALGLEV
jgi:hypothetical protein